MNDIEAQLRDAYRAAAATVSPHTTRELGEQAVTISAPTRRTSRRSRGRIMIPLAAAAAVALTGVLAGVVLPGVLASPHRQGQPGQVATSRVPRFVVSDGGTSPSALTSLVIRDVVTGARVSSIPAPAPGLLFFAVTTSDGTHFVADMARDGDCGAWFYQFRLNKAGQPSALTPYKVPFVRQSVTTIALSEDNETFAYLAAPCPNAHQAQAWLTVLRLQTMATRRWEVPPAVADSFMPLALTANGGLLNYGILPYDDESGVYTMPTSAAPGPALQRSRKVVTSAQFGRSSKIDGYAITPDGRTLYVQTDLSTSNYAAGHRWNIWAIDLATGHIAGIGQFPGAGTNTWSPDWSARRALAISETYPSAPGGRATVRFLVVSLVNGRVLRDLDPARWAATSSLFSW